MVHEMMKEHGDRWVPDFWDPCTADAQYGCYIYVESSKRPGPGGFQQHMTWGILNSTFEGLFQITYVVGYSQELLFEVLDSGWGIVALGYIMVS